VDPAFILEGILFGLLLTTLLGPIFIVLTQTALEKGLSPALVAGVGVWSSDLIIITVCYAFIYQIRNTIEGDEFKFWLGLSGGLILIGFGIGSIFKKIKLNDEYQKFTARNYLEFWMKGFMVNSVNPFTFIFWIGVISTYVIGRSISNANTLLFLGSIIVTIVATDSIKIILAKKIRKKLKEKHIKNFSRIAGAGLIIFGLVLIFKVV
jgi:threonine/homoserine/homoserine lactone efflux protein